MEKSFEKRIPVPRSRPSIHNTMNESTFPSIREHSNTLRDVLDIVTTPESSLNTTTSFYNDSTEEIKRSRSSRNREEDDESASGSSSESDSDEDDFDINEQDLRRRGSFQERGSCTRDLDEDDFHINEQDLSRRRSFQERGSCTRDPSTPTEPKNPTRSNDNFIQTNKFTVLIAVVSAMTMGLVYSLSPGVQPPPDLNSMQSKFPAQDKDLWPAIESAVEDVNTRNQPRTFIFLYTLQSEQILEKLLDELSLFGACSITDCAKKPIEISDKQLNSDGALQDYGAIIEDYKDELQERGIMIVRNLENVRGLSALAFHAFCDEVTPLVKRAVIIFTMKVDEMPVKRDRMKFLEEFFKRKWTEVNADTLNALITRITSMVIAIKPEVNN